VGTFCEPNRDYTRKRPAIHPLNVPLRPLQGVSRPLYQCLHLLLHLRSDIGGRALSGWLCPKQTPTGVFGLTPTRAKCWMKLSSKNSHPADRRCQPATDPPEAFLPLRMHPREKLRTWSPRKVPPSGKMITVRPSRRRWRICRIALRPL